MKVHAKFLASATAAVLMIWQITSLFFHHFNLQFLRTLLTNFWSISISIDMLFYVFIILSGHFNRIMFIFNNIVEMQRL